MSGNTSPPQRTTNLKYKRNVSARCSRHHYFHSIHSLVARSDSGKRNTARIVISLLAVVQTACLYAACADDKEVVDLVILAGQSNAVGYDARPSDLPAHPEDKHVLFWWRCGDPPPDRHDSHTAKWTNLQPQPLGDPRKPRRGRQYGNFAQSEGGFGPEIGFARAIAGRKGRPLAMLKVAFSGTGLGRDWDPKDESPESCFAALTKEFDLASKAAADRKLKLQPRAFLWVQGESDANEKDAPLYKERFREMITALRGHLKQPNLPALLAVNTRYRKASNKFMPQIVTAQKAYADSDPNAKYVDTSTATIANVAHYDSKGTILVGELFAAALLKLEAAKTEDQR